MNELTKSDVMIRCGNEMGIPVLDIGLNGKSKKLKAPSIRTMEKWMNDGVAKATDGCRVEPDGVCEHGRKSWLLVMGVI